MKFKKINRISALLLSTALIFSSCKSINDSSLNEETLLNETSITTTFSETSETSMETSETTTEAVATTTTDATTTTAPPATTAATSLTETVTITTAPAVTEEAVTAPAITQITAPETTSLIAPAETLVTTSTTSVTQAPIQQRLTPITLGYTYNNLSADKKIIYNKILSAAKSHTDMIYFDTPVDVSTIVDIYGVIYTEEINIQYLSDSFKYNSDPLTVMQISFNYSATQIANIESQTEAKAQQIINKITPTMTTFDIVKYFHDTIIKNCIYDSTTEFCSTAYGALVEGRAVCTGYSHAMSLLCNKVGIENALVTGYANEAHMWNMIKLYDNWYNIDVTWDDPDSTSLPDFVMYDYFNVTNAELSQRQIYQGYVTLPVSTATTDNYFVHNGYVANSTAEAKQILYNQYITVTNQGGHYVTLKCANYQAYTEIKQALVTEQGLFAVMAQANEQSVNKFNAATTQLIKNDEMFVLTFIITY